MAFFVWAINPCSSKNKIYIIAIVSILSCLSKLGVKIYKRAEKLKILLQQNAQNDQNSLLEAGTHQPNFQRVRSFCSYIFSKSTVYSFATSLFYDNEIYLAFKQNGSPISGRIFAAIPLFSNIASILHIWYEIKSLNEGVSLTVLPFVLMITLKVVETFISTRVLYKLESYQRETLTTMLFSPLNCFIEFIYFDRQLEDSKILFGYFMTVLDFLNFLAFNKAMDNVFLHKARIENKSKSPSTPTSIQLVNVSVSAIQTEPPSVITNVSENSTENLPAKSKTVFREAGKTMIQRLRVQNLRNIGDSQHLTRAIERVITDRYAKVSLFYNNRKKMMMFVYSAPLILNFIRTSYFLKSVYRFAFDSFEATLPDCYSGWNNTCSENGTRARATRGSDQSGC